MKVFWCNVRNDVRAGILGQWTFYLIGLVLFSVACIPYLGAEGDSALNAGDFLYVLLHGMPKFHPGDLSMDINVLWLADHLLIAIIVTFYPFRELGGFGQQVIVKSRRRVLWWISKCVWVVLSVLVFYGLIDLTVLVFSLISGGGPGFVPHQMASAFYRDAGEMIVGAVLLPILTTVCLSLVELFVSLVTKPIVSILAVSAVLVGSIFVGEDWMIGNYTMMERTSPVLSEGVNVAAGGILMGVLTIAAVTAGCLVIRKRDIR